MLITLQTENSVLLSNIKYHFYIFIPFIRPDDDPLFRRNMVQ